MLRRYPVTQQRDGLGLLVAGQHPPAAAQQRQALGAIATAQLDRIALFTGRFWAETRHDLVEHRPRRAPHLRGVIGVPASGLFIRWGVHMSRPVAPARVFHPFYTFHPLTTV